MIQGLGSDGNVYEVAAWAYYTVGMLGLVAFFCFWEAGLLYIEKRYGPAAKVWLLTKFFNFRYFSFYR